MKLSLRLGKLHRHISQFWTLPKFAEGIAKSEGLDKLLELENSLPGYMEYCTVHGSRWLSKERPELNLFLVLAKGEGFARAVPMPYVRTYNSRLGVPQLVVEYSRPDAPATLAGYAQAVPLPNNVDRSEVYIEELRMLDTEYAEMLAGLHKSL